MDKQEVIWLINTELDKTQDQHIRDMLTDIKASCYSPLTNIDLGYFLGKYENIFECSLTFLKKMALLTKNTNKLINDISSYISKHSQDTKYQGKLIKLLNILINIYPKQDECLLCIESKVVTHILLTALASQETKTVAYETLISYIKLLEDVELVDCISNIYEFCCEQNNLDIFCALISQIPTRLFYSDNVCFKQQTFWNHIEFCISGLEHHLKRQAEYILAKYVENYTQALYHSNALFTCKNFEKTWQVFFMLLDIGKEKQLHLVSPGLKHLKHIFNLPFIWQKCIFKMYLCHSQSSIVYKVAIELLKENYFTNHLQEIIRMIFVAINKNEYNKLSCETFQQLHQFCLKLDNIELKIVVEEIVKISWNPESFFQILQSVLTPENADKVLIEDMLKCTLQLPHIYIRSECVKYLIKVGWDGNDFNQLAQMVSVCKIDLESRLDITEFSYNEERLIESILANVAEGKYIHLGLRILKCLRKKVWKIFDGKLESIDPDAALCIWYEKITSNRELISSDNIEEKSKITNFLLKYFKMNLCEEFLCVYLKLIYISPIWSNNISNIREEIIGKPLLSPNDHTILQQAVALSLTRRFNDIDVLFLCSRGVPMATIKYKPDSSIDLYAKHAIISRIFAVLIFEKMKTQKIEPLLLEELVLLLLDFQTNNKDMLQIYQIVQDIPLKYTGLIDCLYNHLTKLKKDQYFRHILITFISILLTCKNPKKSKNFNFITNDLLKFAEIHPSIRFHFINCIPKHSLDLYLSILVDLYLQGVVVTKDEKTEYNLCQILAKNELSVKGLNFSNPNLVASSATLLAIEKLVHISQNECQIVVNHLIERYMKHFKKRYFPDSKVHYEKLRIVQMILLLLSHPHNRTNTELCERLKSFSYYCLYEETNQNCVRQLLSWILVVAASKSLSEVLDRMQCSAVQVSTLINIIPALYHLVQQSDESILERVISMTLPWTMGSQFRLRVYAQELIRKILEDAKEKHSDFCKKYEYLKTCIDNTINSTQDAYKNSLKTDLVFFTKFNPLENISKQIILVEIPMLNKVHPSEWDCVKLIIDRVKLPKQNEPLTQLFSTDVAKFLKTSDPLLKNYSEALAESNNELIHIQKKITPWKSNLDNLNSQANSDFVLIASLISKPQNLGGLSRTCEVFGIRDITFNDAKVINDKEFKSLSMSSEGWINAIEVKEVDLREYVGSLRSEGFYVIGAEQTAGSEPLNKFQFPRKLALILGNEKTGIPADVIPLLDKCLEIPQFGQTRSLNVHVAGATFIWEYAKQHLVG